MHFCSQLHLNQRMIGVFHKMSIILAGASLDEMDQEVQLVHAMALMLILSEEMTKEAGTHQHQLGLMDLVQLVTNGIVEFLLHLEELVDGTMIPLQLVEETMVHLIGEEKNLQELLVHLLLEEVLEVRNAYNLILYGMIRYNNW